MIIDLDFRDPDNKRIRVTVEPANPDRWREEPYFSELTNWSLKYDVVITVPKCSEEDLKGGLS